MKLRMGREQAKVKVDNDRNKLHLSDMVERVHCVARK